MGASATANTIEELVVRYVSRGMFYECNLCVVRFAIRLHIHFIAVLPVLPLSLSLR